MKLLVYGLNFSPEEIGIGKYTGEMVAALLAQGHDVTVVTAPPYYPQWKVAPEYPQWRYTRSLRGAPPGDSLSVVRCPLWVPQSVSGWKRVIHLLSFACSSLPVVFHQVLFNRPDVIMTVEPAAMCMPTTLSAAWLSKAKAWLHVQDFEVDAAFELGILKSRLLQRLVSTVETWLMRRFDRVSSISPNMVRRLTDKGVQEGRVYEFPNWVDCQAMRPLHDAVQYRAQFGLPPDACIALYAGNIGAKQGLDLIVDAARKCKIPQLLFVICGHGAAYESIAREAEHVKNIKLLPVQPFEVFNQLMNCADIHLLPQKADAADLVMPSKLTGMLATGRPVVACASEGTQIAQVVKGRGIVTPPGNVDALLAAIELLASDAELRAKYATAARDYAVNNLSADAILSKFIRQLEALVENSKSKAVPATSSEAGANVVPEPHLNKAALPSRERSKASPS